MTDSQRRWRMMGIVGILCAFWNAHGGSGWWFVMGVVMWAALPREGGVENGDAGRGTVVYVGAGGGIPLGIGDHRTTCEGGVKVRGERECGGVV